MQVTTQQFADTTVVAPMGRIDHRSAAELEAVLLPRVAEAAARRGALVLDFSGVDYISSVGLRVLMIAAKSMRARKARIGVAALTPTVAEIFTISRFDAVVEVYAGVREALAAMSPSALAALAADPARGGP